MSQNISKLLSFYYVYRVLCKHNFPWGLEEKFSNPAFVLRGCSIGFPLDSSNMQMLNYFFRRICIIIFHKEFKSEIEERFHGRRKYGGKSCGGQSPSTGTGNNGNADGEDYNHQESSGR
jgi:hypothetical protein